MPDLEKNEDDPSGNRFKRDQSLKNSSLRRGHKNGNLEKQASPSPTSEDEVVNSTPDLNLGSTSTVMSDLPLSSTSSSADTLPRPASHLALPATTTSASAMSVSTPELPRPASSTDEVVLTASSLSSIPGRSPIQGHGHMDRSPGRKDKRASVSEQDPKRDEYPYKEKIKAIEARMYRHKSQLEVPNGGETYQSVDGSILARQLRAELQLDLQECQANTVMGDGMAGTTFFGLPLANPKDLEKKGKFSFFGKRKGILGVIHAQSKRNRVVSKHGHINTCKRAEKVTMLRFVKDFFNSMINLGWRYTFSMFAASFFLSWLSFAVIWYIIAYVHGDLDEDQHSPTCLELPIKSFTSCYLLSIEIQHTIGFGTRSVTQNCGIAVVLMSVQSIIGVVIQACMAGIIFAKFTKPISRAQTILFSKNALITMRNGSLYLVARVGDIRQNHLIGCYVYGRMVKFSSTKEGEEIPYHLQKMEFGTQFDGTENYFQMFWPITIAHKIDQNSPLWDIGPLELKTKQFEIIITIEGTVPETSSSVQVRTSYLPNEILWGYRFEHSCVAYDKQLAKYTVSYKTINKFEEDSTPRYSAKDNEDNSKLQGRNNSTVDITNINLINRRASLATSMLATIYQENNCQMRRTGNS